ncbi:hypothetical protein RZE82_06995 [Mollicutes bacterium LVI A0039]|nr:hypothetical protein RZE82_06995 [Mollicutes bacterium LVI A0039]
MIPCLGKKGLLEFDLNGNFKFQVRDRRKRNTFLVDSRGLIHEVYCPVREDTILKVGDTIDLHDTINIYMPAETKQQMYRYRRTREFVEQNYF